MKSLFFFFIVAIISFSFGQQLPINSQFYNNTFIINPATTESKDIHFLASTRQQWVGFNGAPSTYKITAQSNLRNEKFAVGGFLFLDDFRHRLINFQIGCWC